MDSDIIRKLNWGCGPDIAPGWWNSDVVDYSQTVDNSRGPALLHTGNILDGLPMQDGFLDGIVANHSLQSLCAHELDPAVRELHRALRPEGRLRVLVPDIPAAIGAWENDEANWPGFAAISEPWSLTQKFAHYLTWGGQNRTCFTYWTLGELLERNGFTIASKWWSTHAAIVEDHNWTWLAELDSRLGESIVMEAVACA